MRQGTRWTHAVWVIGLFLFTAAMPVFALTADEAAKLLASDGAAVDMFGYSVSISGGRAVIGAWQDDDNGDGSGSAYVFERDNTGNWSLAAKLLAADGAEGDVFGISVSISGDLVLIGASGDDDFGSQSGSAYVFERDAAGNWSQAAKLLASDGEQLDYFGGKVSISGDRAMIGASSDNDNGTSSGSAYVFERDGAGNWTQAAKLLPSDGAADDIFGCSVAVSGDRAVIGARRDDDNGTDSGSAYVFERDDAGNWSEEAKLLPSGGAAFDSFGYSVAISGDLAVIGVYRDDDNGTDSGSAYVFSLTDDTPPGDVTVTLTSPNTTGTYRPADTQTLEWTITGADPCQGIVLSMKRQSFAHLPDPDDLNWYRFTEHNPQPAFTPDPNDANNCSAVVTIPGGLSEDSDWEFFVRHAASDVYDASDVTFTYEIPVVPAQYTLTVTTEGDGSGTITSTPTGIDCGATCSASFSENTPVTLTATPETDSVFIGWSGDADCSDGSVTMTGDVNCTATFEILVVDTILPVITLEPPNPMTITVGDTFVDPGFSADDDVDGDLTNSVLVSGIDDLDTNTVGTYILFYNVTDAAGNPAVEVVRTVIVEPALNVKLNPTPVDFGTVSSAVTDIVTKPVVLSNAGSQVVWVTSISLEGADASQFEILSVGGVETWPTDIPFPLTPSSNTPIELGVIPPISPADGYFNANLLVTAEDDIGNEVTISGELIATNGEGFLTIDMLETGQVILEIDQDNRPLYYGAPVGEEHAAQATWKISGLVADGNARLLLRARTSVASGQVRFRISASAETEAVLHDLSHSPNDSGSLEVTVPITDLGDTRQASAILRAGERFLGAEYIPEIHFQVEACVLDTATGECGSLVARQPVLETRAPVVFVHGIWSSDEAWDEPMWEDADYSNVREEVEYRHFPIAFFDYSGDGDHTADEGPTQVMAADDPDLANEIFAACRVQQKAGRACTRADIVAHSMGGLVTRKFIHDNEFYRDRDNYMQGSIRRFLTLGTPHTGSPLANLLLSQPIINTDCPHDEDASAPGIQNQHIAQSIGWLGQLKGNEVFDGAVHDLAQGSDLLQALNSTNQEVPTYALVGDVGQEIELDPEWVTLGLDDLLIAGNIEPAGCTYHDLYGDDNSDGIVPVPSARGRVTAFEGVDAHHTTMPDKWDIGRRVVDLLNGPLLSFARFASISTDEESEELLALKRDPRRPGGDGGWSSFVSRIRQLLPSGFLAILGISDAHGQSAPSILLSVDRISVVPGDTLYFSAQVQGIPESPLILAQKQSSWADDISPYEWSVDLPITASGNFDYFVAAEIDGEVIRSNVVSVAVVPDASSLVQLAFDPQTPLVLGLNDRKQLSVEGRFQDGYVRDLSEQITGTVYAEQIVDGLQVLDGDSPFISLTDDGVVTGLAVGEAEVRAENNGVSTVRRVYIEDFEELRGGGELEIVCDLTGNGMYDWRDKQLFTRGCRKGTATWTCDLDEDGSFNWRDTKQFVNECRAKQ